MKFGPIAVTEAEGAVLAHATRLADRRLKKGHVLTDDDLALLAEAGIETVIAARLGSGDVPEDQAAEEIGRAIAGDNVSVDKPFTGRCNLTAGTHGVIAVDRTKLDRLNLVDEAVTVATVQPYGTVNEGQMVATIKIIPFAISRPVLDTALAVAHEGGPFIRVAPFSGKKVGLIQTRLPGMKESILDKTVDITTQRLDSAGSVIAKEIRCGHDQKEVARALAELTRGNCDLFLIFGASATVDRHDVAPAGVEEVGGTIEHFGMPVDPGNLLFLGSLDGKPVIGMPGCARSPKINGFDWVLWRCLADLEVTRRDIMLMGAGGLLTEIPERGQARERGKAGDTKKAPSAPKIAAVVLAAGASRRMGRNNKLLADVGGKPMIARVVETIEESGIDNVTVVTGHEADRVQSALADRSANFVHNPDYAMGLSTSLRIGIRSLPEDVDAAIVVLGDMPLVTAEHIGRLVQAFNPVEGRSICLPVHGRKRGNPVLWGRQHFAEMQRLSGDVGARQLLEEHADQVTEVIIDDDGVLFDVDTPERLSMLAGKTDSAA